MFEIDLEKYDHLIELKDRNHKKSLSEELLKEFENVFADISRLYPSSYQLMQEYLADAIEIDRKYLESLELSDGFDLVYQVAEPMTSNGSYHDSPYKSSLENFIWNVKNDQFYEEVINEFPEMMDHHENLNVAIRVAALETVMIYYCADLNIEDERNLSNKELQKFFDHAVSFKPSKFTASQQFEIDKGKEKGLDVSLYADPKYDEFQMIEIRKGLESGIDVNAYLDENYDNFQMFQLRLGIEQDLDISLYSDPEFHGVSMAFIRECLEKGIDVQEFAKPEYNWDQMKLIQKGIEQDLKWSLYADPKFNSHQMTIIKEGLENGLTTEQVELYAHPLYDSRQMHEIYQGLIDSLPVGIYLDPEFDHYQMESIREGLEEHLEVECYADSSFDVSQMDWIREGLRDGLDVSVYADPKFDEYQMQIIYEGLYEGLPHKYVELYARPDYDPPKMIEMFEQLVELKNDGRPAYILDTKEFCDNVQEFDGHFKISYDEDGEVYFYPPYSSPIGEYIEEVDDPELLKMSQTEIGDFLEMNYSSADLDLPIKVFVHTKEPEQHATRDIALEKKLATKRQIER